MHKKHKEILKLVKEKAGTNKLKFNKKRANYGGYNDPEYGLSKPEKRKVVKEWKEKNKSISIEELINLIDSLFSGNSDDEKVIAAIMVEEHKKVKRAISPQKIEEWFNNLKGWKQVDSLCQSAFSAEDLLSNWKEWKETIINLSLSKNKNKKGASAVLLIRAVREKKDSRIANLAFKILNNLKQNKDKLVAKANSWLLREMIKNYKKEVEKFIKENKKVLPSLVTREVSNKLKNN
ncbi:MAG: DNA alkylation repair protein [Minisyncoccales bacterium]